MNLRETAEALGLLDQVDVGKKDSENVNTKKRKRVDLVVGEKKRKVSKNVPLLRFDESESEYEEDGGLDLVEEYELDLSKYGTVVTDRKDDFEPKQNKLTSNLSKKWDIPRESDDVEGENDVSVEREIKVEDRDSVFESGIPEDVKRQIASGNIRDISITDQLVMQRELQMKEKVKEKDFRDDEKERLLLAFGGKNLTGNAVMKMALQAVSKNSSTL